MTILFKSIMSNKISLIVPIYNGSSFISSLIYTINAITYDNLEVIFIDNNSTDDTLKILKEAVLSLKKNHVILSELLQGAGYARNKGIKSATGHYLAFLDCDDKISPIKFEKDIELFEEHNVDFVFCRTTRNYEDGRIVKHPIDGFVEGVNEAPSLGLLWLKNFFYLQGTGSIMIKTDVVKELKCFNVTKTGEDAFLFIRLGLCYKGYFYNKEYFNYYRHSNSTISKNNKENGALLSYHNLRKDLFNDEIVLKNDIAKKLIKKQLQTDLLKLSKIGFNIEELVKDEKLSKLKLDYLLFNPLSRLINKMVSKTYYNPFFRLWNKIN